MDAARIRREIEWLKDHPEYEEMPATIREFLGPEYLNFTTARPGLIEALESIFGEEINPDRISKYERAMYTGAIGIGKTTFASIAIPYMLHVTLCLRNPQEYYGLAAGTRIAFMQMSTSAKQATEVIFGDLKARIDHSPWFVNNYPYDDKFTKQMRFPKDVWVLPGSSDETAFEGYNILGGILDEMDSHKITNDKDYADVGFNAIHSRIASRYPDFSNPDDMGHRGLLICIGQMKKANGFAGRKYKAFRNDRKAFVMRQAIWESFGWDKFTRPDGTRASFWYDTKTKKIVPSLLVSMIKNPNLIEVPNAYRQDFENNPETALRDLAGIPPSTSDAWISLVDRIEECSARWTESHDGSPSPVRPSPTQIEFEDWFTANGDPRRRVLHIDFARSGNGDALGMAMGYVDRLVEVKSEEKPYIVIDCLMRLKARPGEQLIYSDVREIIYELRDERGFRIKRVTMDGFESTDTLQQLRKKKFETEYLSADKSTLPYEDLRDAIYERRIEWPQYMTFIRVNDGQLVDIALTEIMGLSFNGKKVDHPPDGSKDVADAIAGVTTTLMGDRTYRKGVRSSSLPTFQTEELAATGTTGQMGNVLQFPGGMGLQAPVPPSGTDVFGLTIPDRLRPR